MDVLGLLRPAPRSRAISTRGQHGVPLPLELRCATPLPRGGAARKALVTALGTHTLDDSDVFVVLRGQGGGGPRGVRARVRANPNPNPEPNPNPNPNPNPSPSPSPNQVPVGPRGGS